MIKICPRCKKRKNFSDDYYVCSDCRTDFDEDEDIEELTDDGWKSYY